MKIKYLKLRRWLLLAILGAMGVASCSKDMYGCPEDDNTIRPMYGCPTKEYNDTLLC